MPDIAAALGRKYGPLPGYAWAGIVGVGTFVIIRRRRSSSATAPGGGAPAIADTTDQQAYQTGYGDGYGAAGASGYGAGDLGQIPLPTTDPSAGTGAADGSQGGAAPVVRVRVVNKLPKPAKAHHPAKAKKKRDGSVSKPSTHPAHHKKSAAKAKPKAKATPKPKKPVKVGHPGVFGRR